MHPVVQGSDFMNPKKDMDWFEPHRFGVGGRPVTWQAIVAIVLLVTSLRLVWTALSGLMFAVSASLIIATYLVVMAAKTRGGLRWRWNEVD